MSTEANINRLFVLLPGMIGTDELFAPVLNIIPPAVKVRVITYPVERCLETAQLLELIRDRLEGEVDLILIGESFSAPLALAFAAANPQRVAAVILSAGYIRPPWPRGIRWLIGPFLVRFRLPSWLIRFFAAGGDASEELVDWIRRAFEKPDAAVMAHRARSALREDFTPALLACRAPILYLRPVNDRLVRSWNLKQILRLRPDVLVQELPGPHLILQVKPQICWNYISQFVQAEASQLARATSTPKT